MTGKQALEKLRKDLLITTVNDYHLCLDIIEKELKALEIIKRDIIEVINLIDTYNTYEEMIQDYYAYGDEESVIKSKEEFDLLKEVLL